MNIDRSHFTARASGARSWPALLFALAMLAGLGAHQGSGRPAQMAAAEG